ncbi:MAG: hypothetical protein ABFC24_08280 [Methanoregulaceae archaeon]
MIPNPIRKTPHEGKPKNRKKSYISILGAALLLVVMGCGAAVQAAEDTSPEEESNLLSIGNILDIGEISQGSDADDAGDICKTEDVRCYNGNDQVMGTTSAQCRFWGSPKGDLCSYATYNTEMRSCIQAFGNQVYKAVRISDCHA